MSSMFGGAAAGTWHIALSPCSTVGGGHNGTLLWRNNTYKAGREGFSKGGIRFCFGLAKNDLANSRKMFLPMKSFTLPSLYRTLSWLGAIAYMGQIYFDFSACR